MRRSRRRLERGAVVGIIAALVGCTPEYHNHIDEGALQVEKGAIQPRIECIELTAPVTIVYVLPDGGTLAVAQPIDAGAN